MDLERAEEDWAMRLMCMESLTARRVSVQPRHSRRVLRELLHIDHRYVVTSNPYVDGDITLSMRTKLAEWIYEVHYTQHRLI